MASGGGRQEGKQDRTEPERMVQPDAPRRHTPAEPDRHLRPAGHVCGESRAAETDRHGAHAGIAPLLRTPQAQRLRHAGRHKDPGRHRRALGLRRPERTEDLHARQHGRGAQGLRGMRIQPAPHRRPDLLAQPVGQIKPHTLCQPDGGGRRRHGNRLHAALRLPRPGQPAVEHGQPEGGSVLHRHLRRQRHPVRDRPRRQGAGPGQPPGHDLPPA